MVTLTGCVAALVAAARHSVRGALLVAIASLLTGAPLAGDRVAAVHLAVLFASVVVLGTAVRALAARDHVGRAPGRR